MRITWSGTLNVIGAALLAAGLFTAYVGAIRTDWIGALPGIAIAVASSGFFMFAAIFERLDRILALLRAMRKAPPPPQPPAPPAPPGGG